MNTYFKDDFQFEEVYYLSKRESLKKMKRILLIKLTSLGDLIHTLPALNDAYEADASVEFHWAIDADFSEVALWHPAVTQVFRTSHRKWFKHLTAWATYKGVQTLLSEIRRTKYDLVLDGQGNFKTALLGMCARGTRAGYDRKSVREWIAHLAYQKKIEAPRTSHAITRLRMLFAGAIGYRMPQTPPSFKLKENSFVPPPIELPSRYLVFVHNASWQTKLWPEEHWIELIRRSADHGFQILLPWGTLEERGRAERLAVIPSATVLPRLTLSEMGSVLKNAAGAVCMDTGLSHLAAALNTPSITLYGSTDAGLTGSSGKNQIHLRSEISCSPCHQKHCPLKQNPPPCLARITPTTVLQRLLQIVAHPRQKTALLYLSQ